MTFEAGIDQDRSPFSGMTVIAAFFIRRMQNVLDHSRAIAAMGVVAGDAVVRLFRKAGMGLLDGLG